jgi:ATP-dependent exoDNAse (exonuclease V) beta subunit
MIASDLLNNKVQTSNTPNGELKHITPSPGWGRGGGGAGRAVGDNGAVGSSSPLTVFKASAGSGKTFTLAVEYIKLLVEDPTNYRYTLAVTFTNKATQEMKQRILSKLYGIAHSLPDADDYYNKVKDAFPTLSERVVRGRAETALTLLIHDYNRFRVETIDSFFQRVLRNLARELGLTANLQVMLNDQEVEEQAVDNIISNIDNGNDPLLSWIMDFVNERMADDKNWNVISQIKSFGKNIFSDFYKDHQEELRRIMNDADFFKDYNSRLRALKAKAVSDMKDYADRYDAIATEHNLTDACYTHGHSNVPGYFEKLSDGSFANGKTKMPNSYVLKGMDNPDAFVKKSDINTPEAQAIREFVAPLLEEAEEARKHAVVTINSVDLTLQNINQLRLLGRIEQEVKHINDDNNDYPLSNTQKLLNNLIDKQDSPFIYEKIGGQLRYIMIDEFQDTSTIQWANFKVLLDDCIAHQNGSLIVGDVKQSIYRWRNGDWRLLQSLNEKNYPETVHVEPLKVNYRSQRNIVDFNNAFFNSAAALLTEDAPIIKEAYEDVSQAVPAKKPEEGLIEVKMLPSNDYDNEMIVQVQKTIEMLLEKGVPYSKIAIIVRKNKHIRLLADYFLHNPVTVDGEPQMLKMVSDEAFRLDASEAVNVIVNAMRFLTHPTDRLTEAFLVKAYTQKEIAPQDIKKDADNKDADNKDADRKDNLEPLLPSEYVLERTALLSMPLIDLAERLYVIFRLDRLSEQNAYVCAFFDQLANYLKRHIGGIDDFLETWDEELCSKSIHSDSVDGIRLLTVHKSKGLEFDNVIIPYCDWKLETMMDILWVAPTVSPYKELPVVPVNLNANKLKESIYATDYLAEHIKNIIDNVNILYVAFTRASRNLFIIGKKDKPDFPSELINRVMGDMLIVRSATPDEEKVKMEPTDEEDGSVTYRYGTLSIKKETIKKEVEKSEQSNIFEEKENGFTVNIENTKMRATFLQSNDSNDFMTPPEELEEEEKRRSYINTGDILHKLFSTIHNINEVDDAIAQLEFDGVLYDRPMTREQLKDYINKALADPQVRDWFSPRWRVFNECSILYYDTEEQRVREQRPDRVVYDGKRMIVIDFKTGREQEKHKEQVRRYIALLNDMGYENVEGYLWYIRHHKIVNTK